MRPVSAVYDEILACFNELVFHFGDQNVRLGNFISVTDLKKARPFNFYSGKWAEFEVASIFENTICIVSAIQTSTPSIRQLWGVVRSRPRKREHKDFAICSQSRKFVQWISKLRRLSISSIDKYATKRNNLLTELLEIYCSKKIQ